MLYIFNQNEELQTILKEYTEASHTEQLNKDNFFEFWVPANHPDSQFIKEENLVAFKDEDGELRLFVIKELEEVHDDVLYKEVFCKAAWMDELEDEALEESSTQDQTMEDALSQALQDTRWQVGEVAELGLNEVDFYFESVLSAINNILSTWGGEVKDRILISGNKITGRYIDILPRRGADTGKTLSISKDLQSIHRTVVSYPKTALYGRGKGEEGADGREKRLTFEEVEWSTQKDDPVDKPFGQKWVGDPDALKKYGRENFTRHRFDFFDSSDEEDPKQLLMDTWNALQEKIQILVSYDLSAISLEKIAGLEHEKVRLGDTVFIIDREFVPEILVEGRVIELKRVRNEPERTEIKLGNFLPLYTDDTRLDDVVDTINNNSGKWSSVDDSNFPNIEPPVPTNVQATGAFRSIIIEWDFVPDLYIANYEVFASQVKGFHPDSSNLVFRGKTSICSYNADVNQQWYFRVRAVNTHGKEGPFSSEESDTTARIISDDILFGEEIAEELRELSKEADILAGDTIGIDKMKEEALEAIQETAEKYTDEEIRETEEEIQEELAKKAGLNFVDGEFTMVKSDLADMLDEMEDLEEYASSIDQKADSISLDVSAIEKTVDDNTESILIVGSSITQLSDSIHLKVEETQAQVDTIDEDVTRVSSQMSELSVDVDGISTSVKSLESDFSDLGTRVSSSETSIIQLSDSISLNAKELEIVDGRMTQAEASLSVHADKIESKVERDGIISSINQTAESVKIDAEMIELTGDVYFSDGEVLIEEGAVGTLAIKDGSITNAHLGTAIIKEAQINDLAVTNAKISNLGIDGAKIKDATIESAKISSLCADVIDGGTISGVKFETTGGSTGTLSLSGGVLKSEYDDGWSTKIEAAALESQIGDLAKAQINGNGLFIYRLNNDQGSSSITQSSEQSKSYLTIETSNHLRFSTGSPLVERLRIDDTGLSKIQGLSFEHSSSIGFNQYGNIKAKDTTSDTSYWAIVNKLGDIVFKAPLGATNKTIELNAPSGAKLTISSDNVGPNVKSMDIFNRTYSTSTNMYITSNGNIGRTTSASKYKMLIEDLSIDNPNKILNLRPKTWYDKPSIENYAQLLKKESDGEEIGWENEDIPYMERISGLIAEDLVESGLENFITYGSADEHGNREIEGIQYDRLWIMLLPLVKEQKIKIEELENRINKLEAASFK